MKTVRMKHNCDAGSWRQNSAFAFPQKREEIGDLLQEGQAELFRRENLGGWLKVSRNRTVIETLKVR